MSYTPLVDTILSGDPNAPTPTAGDNDTSVATTAFVQGELGDYLPLAGGSMTGDITLGSGVDINFNDTNSGLQWSDVRLDRTAADVISLSAGDYLRIQQDPVNADDAVRKSYVDDLVNSNVHRHEAVDVATTGNITLSGEQTIDTVLTSGSRVLVKDQTTTSENGIYISASGAWTRAADFDEASEIQGGDTTFVLDGSTNLHTTWTQTETVTTVGSDAILWVQTGSATVVNAISDLSDVNTAGVVDGAILRYEAGAGEWQDTTTLLFDDNGQLQASAIGSTGGLLLGGDAQLYRQAADVLATPDSFRIEANGGATTLNLTDTTVGVGFTIGGDTQITRTAANILALGSGDKLQQNAAPTAGDDLVNKTYADALVGNSNLNDLGDVNTAGVVDGALLRYEATGTTWEDTAALLFSDAGQLQVTTDGASAGILIGTDTQLYRVAANELRTPDAFTVDGAVTASSTLAVTGATTLSAGVTFAISTKTANYTVDLDADHVILADNSGDTADLIISLPATHNAGDMVHIKDAGGNAASGVNQILVSPDAGDSIDGLGLGVDFELTVDYQAVTFVSDGTNWYAI